MTDIQALVFTFIDRHKSVVKAFGEGKLERHLDNLCSSYYGCAGKGFHLMSTPKGFDIGWDDESEHHLNKAEMCSLITEFLREE